MTIELNITIITVMSSIIRVTKNNQVYVYESKSYWDKEKKAPRSKMVYLGKEDTFTKQIKAPGKQWYPKSSRDYGNVFLLEKISTHIGLIEILKEAFPDEWRKLITCAFFEVLEAKPLYLCGTWLESTYINFVEKLPSQRISELLKSVGENVHARFEFSKLWSQRRGADKFIVFDITSISSYSKLIESVEWGYNRDKEKLPQINFGMVFGQLTMLPIFYNVYQGSIRDVSTLKNILKFLSQFKLSAVTFTLDKGFYSSDNISELKRRKLHFIIPLTFTVDKAYELIEKHQGKITDISNAMRVNKQILYCVRDKISINQYLLNAYIYFNKKKRVADEERLLEKLMEAEEKVEQRHFRDREKLQKYIAEHASELKKFFIIRKVKGFFVLRRDKERIGRSIKQMGYVVMLSTRSMKAKEILLLYRNKDCVEKSFDNMKNELSSNRLRVHSRESMEGRLFISFLSLILYSFIHNIMREKNLVKKYTIEEVLYEIKKLKIIKLENKRKILTEISKTQKELFMNLINEVPEL